MKISTYTLHAMMVLAATATFTLAQATMKNACGAHGHMAKNACSSHGSQMKKGYSSSKKSHMKNACGS
jgi:hypothetical protein